MASIRKRGNSYLIVVSMGYTPSASGIPQHWQISCLGEPSSVLMETSKSFESSFRVSIFGVVSPVSLN